MVIGRLFLGSAKKNGCRMAAFIYLHPGVFFRYLIQERNQPRRHRRDGEEAKIPGRCGDGIGPDDHIMRLDTESHRQFAQVERFIYTKADGNGEPVVTVVHVADGFAGLNLSLTQLC